MAQESQIKIRDNQSEKEVKKGLLRSIIEAIVTDNVNNRSGQGEILASEYMRAGTIDRAQKYGRGEVARNEQIRILKRVGEINGEPIAPRTRGEVAAQEQMRIFKQATMAASGKQSVPRTRGEVAAQEQMRIFGQVLS